MDITQRNVKLLLVLLLMASFSSSIIFLFANGYVYPNSLVKFKADSTVDGVTIPMPKDYLCGCPEAHNNDNFTQRTLDCEEQPWVTTTKSVRLQISPLCLLTVRYMMSECVKDGQVVAVKYVILDITTTHPHGGYPSDPNEVLKTDCRNFEENLKRLSKVAQTGSPADQDAYAKFVLELRDAAYIEVAKLDFQKDEQNRYYGCESGEKQIKYWDIKAQCLSGSIQYTPQSIITPEGKVVDSVVKIGFFQDCNTTACCMHYTEFCRDKDGNLHKTEYSKPFLATKSGAASECSITGMNSGQPNWQIIRNAKGEITEEKFRCRPWCADSEINGIVSPAMQ